MPPFEKYKNHLGGERNNQIHKMNADLIIEDTWWNDINSRVAYLYDYYHDDDKTLLKNTIPENNENKIPIDIKFMSNSSQTFAKDRVTYHIQMRPSQDCNVPYYKEFFEDRYGAEFPVGLYIDIQDNKEIYNRWMVVGMANSNDVQFPTYEVLRCDYIFRYMYRGAKYEIASVLRSQNS